MLRCVCAHRPVVSGDQERSTAKGKIMNRALWSKTVIGGLAVFALGFGAHMATQAQPARAPSPLRMPGHRYDLPPTKISAAQIEAHRKSMEAVKETDVAMTMVKMGGGSDNAQIGVSVVLRPTDGENKYYAVHDDVAEVYYVIEGKGTMKVGGTISDWERRPVSIENGEGSRGTVSVGAKDVTLAKGDMLIIPAGTPHKWEKSDQYTYYVVVRADPKGVAPLLDLGKAQFVRPKP
jgi:mannose-6-phosphate isomerase-like protein (cupin superfamily)